MFGEFKLKARKGDIIFFESPEIETVRYTIINDENIDVLVKGYEAASKAKKISRKGAASSEHKIFIDSANFFKKTDIEKSLTFIEKSLKVLSDRGDNEKTAQSFSTLGDIYLHYKQYDLAISNYKSALNDQYSTETKINLGRAYLLSSDYESARNIFLEIGRASCRERAYMSKFDHSVHSN